MYRMLCTECYVQNVCKGLSMNTVQELIHCQCTVFLFLNKKQNVRLTLAVESVRFTTY